MNRAKRRLKHHLVELRQPLQIGIRLSSKQKKYSCTCNSGWLSISGELPLKSFQAHIESFRKEASSVQPTQ